MPQEVVAPSAINYYFLIKDLQEFAHSIAKENDEFIFLKKTPKYNLKKSARYI